MNFIENIRADKFHLFHEAVSILAHFDIMILMHVLIVDIICGGK